MSKSLTKIINSMTYNEKIAWFATARSVTVGEITQVFEDTLVTSYTARVHGFIISDGKNYMHKTKEEARAYGKRILAAWKAEYAQLTANNAE